MTASQDQAKRLIARGKPTRLPAAEPVEGERSARRERQSVAGKHDDGGTGDYFVPSSDASAIQAATLTGDRMPRSRRAWNDDHEDGDRG